MPGSTSGAVASAVCARYGADVGETEATDWPDDAARALADRLVREHGETFAERAGIELTDEPGALWRLFVVAQLLSARIRAEVALAAADELFRAGCETPASTRTTSWQQRVDALGRGGYRRYDFSTSTRLGANATMMRERWGDDLRRLRDEAERDPRRIVLLLQEFDGIGPAGAGIVVREVQGVWALSEPFVDTLVVKGARALGWPTAASRLAGLVPASDLPALCAALVTVARTPSLAADLTA